MSELHSTFEVHTRYDAGLGAKAEHRAIRDEDVFNAVGRVATDTGAGFNGRDLCWVFENEHAAIEFWKHARNAVRYLRWTLREFGKE